MESPPTGSLAELIRELKAKEGTAPKKPRDTGATTLFDDIKDAAVYVASKALAAGVRGGEALARIIKEGMAQHYPHLADHEARIHELATGLIDKSIHDGEINIDKFDEAVAALDEAPDAEIVRTPAKPPTDAAKPPQPTTGTPETAPTVEVVPTGGAPLTETELADVRKLYEELKVQ